MKVKSQGVIGKIGVALLVAGVCLVGARRAQAAVAADDHSVLILDSTVIGGASSLEGTSAAGLGLTVVVVDSSEWLSMSNSDFASFRAIVLGDPECGSLADMDAAVSNRTVWGPVVNGNVITIGTDPAFHNGSHPGAGVLVSDGIGFASAQHGKTGAYLCLSCDYTGITTTDAVQVLDQFGSFSVTGVDCLGNVQIVASHPAIASLTDSDLSGWGCSVHEAFITWPNNFIPLAIAVDGPPVFEGGTPYILAKGKGLVPGGSGCFSSIVSGLELPRATLVPLSRLVAIIQKAEASGNSYAARKDCDALARRLSGLARRGLVSPSDVSSLQSCCSGL